MTQIKPLQWLVRLTFEDVLEVVAGPFPTEEELENGVIATLKQDGINILDDYFILARDSSGLVEVEDFDDDYWDYVTAVAAGVRAIDEGIEDGDVEEEPVTGWSSTAGFKDPTAP